MNESTAMNTKKHPVRNALLVASTGLWGLFIAACVVTSPSVVSPPEIAGATFVGSGECAMCHEGVTSQFHDTTHGHLVVSETKGRELGCEACHGPASLHVESGGDSASIVKGANVCATCHQDVEARFRMTSFHPATQGAAGCTVCHEPHGNKQATLTSTNNTCTSCHQNVRGPHVFEHPPAAEDCTTCHNPHGSPFRRLLTMTEPMLCLQCHTIANNRHGQTGAASTGQVISGAVLRNCSSCHGQVHGSSQDQHLRY